MIASALLGGWNTWQQFQNNALRRRVEGIERDHRECQELLNQIVPNDSKLDEFMERVIQVRAAMKLQGTDISFRVASNIARRMTEGRSA